MHYTNLRRRVVPTLAKDYADVADALLETLEKVSANLAAAVNHNDPVIDQLLSIKQTAWLLRSTAGEASVLVSTGLMSTGSTPRPRPRSPTPNSSAASTQRGAHWNWRHRACSYCRQASVSAMATAKTAYFDPQYMALRDRLMNAVVVGEKPEITADQWTPITVGRMASAVAVAERALEEARGHAARSNGRRRSARSCCSWCCWLPPSPWRSAA